MPHTHNKTKSDNSSKNIAIAFILNSVFVVIELIGGIYTNSIAILSDALHDFGDCISLGVAWGLQKKAQKKRDRYYSYGYKRFSLLGSIFLSGVLTISSLFVIIEACKRLINPQDVKAEGMIWIAIFGVIINGAAALRLKKGDSLNEKAVFLHIMEDTLGWLAVLIVSIVMLFVNARQLDPILSIAISIWVLSNVYRNIRETFKILLQAIPSDIDIIKVQKEIESLEGICSIHDLHIWSLDGNSHVMTTHAVVSKESDIKILKHTINQLALKHSIEHTTIEFEDEGEKCGYISCNI